MEYLTSSSVRKMPTVVQSFFLALALISLSFGVTTMVAFASQGDTAEVTINKYIDGVQATAINANSTSFPMTATYTIGGNAGGPSPFSLSPIGSNSQNPYEAITGGVNVGDNYSVTEDTSTTAVGLACTTDPAAPAFSLVGYTSGDTLAQAQAATPTMTPPSFTALTGPKFVIVWNHSCAVVVPPTDVTVSISKFVEGAQATAVSAGSATFNMNASWDATNIGAGSGIYALNVPNAYQTSTIAMTSGADYATSEVMDSTVGEVCTTNPAAPAFSLVGYTTGNTFAQAAAATPTMTSPAFTGLTQDKYVIVWNHSCAVETPPATVTVTVDKYIDSVQATNTNAGGASFSMNATTNTVPSTYSLASTNTPNPYQSVTPAMASGSSYSTSEVMNTTVGEACTTNPAAPAFSLLGYKVGDTLAAAQAAATTASVSLSNITSNKFVLVMNHSCSGGQIGGEVVGSGALSVTSVTATDTSAIADGSFENGWKYVFHITIPTNELDLAMKFSDWSKLSPAATIPVAGKMRISSLQANNANATVLITAANTYTTPTLHMVTDLDPVAPGIQVDVTVEAAVAVGTPDGSYTTSYGVQTI